MSTELELIALSKRLIAELRRLNSTLIAIENFIRTISNQEKAYNQNQQAEQRGPQILNAELKIPEYIRRDHQANDKRQYRIQVWLAIATSLAFIAAAIYAGYARSERNAMLESNQINREALESVQRAFVALEDIDFHVGYRIVPPHDKLWEFSAVYENNGMTPAVLSTRYLDVGNELPNGPSIEQFLGDRRRWITMPAEIAPKSTRRIGAIQQSESFVLGGFSLSVSDREKVARLLKLGRVCVWGWVAYRDVFPHTPPHITEFCEHIVGIEPDAKPIRVHTQPCNEHNCSDERCNEYATITSTLPK